MPSQLCFHRAWAVTLTAVLGCGTLCLAQGNQNVNSTSTPHTPDGKVDLSGYWGNLTGDGAQVLDPNAPPPPPLGGLQTPLDGTVQSFGKYFDLFEKDAQVNMRAVRNKPLYKPEYWAKIRETDWDFSRAKDPDGNCLPGMPRLGIPQRIVELPNEVLLFYENLNRFRIIPTDGRPHDAVKTGNPSWFGDSVAHWEGDTLVIDSIGFNDEGWLGPNGYLHTEDTHITERVHRDGNVIHWETTVEDPMLLQPWHMDPLTAKLNANPKATLWEELPCSERDKNNLADPNEGR
jgi:hypothetical protein